VGANTYQTDDLKCLEGKRNGRLVYAKKNSRHAKGSE